MRRWLRREKHSGARSCSRPTVLTSRSIASKIASHFESCLNGSDGGAVGSCFVTVVILAWPSLIRGAPNKVRSWLVGRHRSDGSTDHRIRANNVTTRADASATYK